MIDPKNLREVIQVLKEFGVSQFKSDEFEMTLSNSPLPIVQLPPIPAAEEAEIKHKVEELTSLLKLGDAELVDRLFPDNQQEAE